MDREEIQVLFDQFPSYFAGYNIKMMCKKCAKNGSLTKQEFFKILDSNFNFYEKDDETVN